MAAFKEQVQEVIKQKYEGMKGAIKAVKYRKYVAPEPLASSSMIEPAPGPSQTKSKPHHIKKKYASPILCPEALQRSQHDTYSRIINTPPTYRGFNELGRRRSKTIHFRNKIKGYYQAYADDLQLERGCSFPYVEEKLAFADGHDAKNYARKAFFSPKPGPLPQGASSFRHGRQTPPPFHRIEKAPYISPIPGPLRRVGITNSVMSMDGAVLNMEHEEYTESPGQGQHYDTAMGKSYENRWDNTPNFQTGLSAAYRSVPSDTASSISTNEISELMKEMEMEEIAHIMHNLAMYQRARKSLILEVSKLGENDQQLMKQISVSSSVSDVGELLG